MIVLTLLVRDEVDIIAANIGYHRAQGIDRLIVTDNGSRDGTMDILTDLQHVGAIDLLREAPSDFSQHRWVTAMARRAYAMYRADWVIHADADEFFVYRGGTLREAFGRVGEGVTRMNVARHDFVPFERPCVAPPPIEMIYRKAVSLNLERGVLPPKVVHRGAPDVVVTQGNHDARSDRFWGPPLASEIEIFHYPIRSFPQFESKVRNGGSGYARNRDLPRVHGGHKRRWYDLLLGGKLGTEYFERCYFGPGKLRQALASGELVEERALSTRLGQASHPESRDGGGLACESERR